MILEALDLETEVRRAAQGDREAFRRLVQGHQAMVCSVAYAVTGDFSLSEEIAQEVFLNAWQRLGQLRTPERFGAWLAAITRNRARDFLRAKGKEARWRKIRREQRLSRPD